MQIPAKHNYFLYLVIFAAAIIGVSNFFLQFSVDVSLHFFHAIKLVKEGGLYTRWIEVMPPTIYLLYSIPVYLNEITGLNYITAMNIFTLTLSLVSLGLIADSLKKGGVEEGLRLNFICTAIILFFILPALTMSTHDREHLLLILGLPWIFNRILKLKSALPVILFAAVGFSIKQYNYLYPILFILFGTEFNKDYLKKVFSRENIILGATVVIMNVLYFLNFREYYTELLPVLLTAYKGYYKESYQAILVALIFYPVILFFMRKGELRPYLRQYIILFVTSLLLTKLNGAVMYIWNHAIAVATIAMMHIAYSYDKEKTRSTLKIIISIMVVVTVIMQGMVIYFLMSGKPSADEAECQKEMTEYTAKPYIYLSVGDWAFQKDYTNFDTYNYGTSNHQFAIDHLWMLPWLYDHFDEPKANIVKDYMAGKLREALARNKDASIIVLTSNIHYKIPDGFNILEMFRDKLGMEHELATAHRVRVLDVCKKARGETIEVWSR